MQSENHLKTKRPKTLILGHCRQMEGGVSGGEGGGRRKGRGEEERERESWGGGEA